MGVAIWLEAHKQNQLKYRPAQDRTAIQRFGEMTAAEVLLAPTLLLAWLGLRRLARFPIVAS